MMFLVMVIIFQSEKGTYLRATEGRLDLISASWKKNGKNELFGLCNSNVLYTGVLIRP